MLVVPTSCLLKVRAVGERVRGGVTPVPVRLTFCGLLVAASVIVSVAVRVPDAVGEKVMLKLQFELAARLEPHVLVCEKSPGLLPVNTTPLIATAMLELLLRVTVWAALALPRLTLPKFTLEA